MVTYGKIIGAYTSTKMHKTIFMKKLLIVFLLFIPFAVGAHPGRTDSSGCHTCRTNCAKWGLGSGEYHCHQAKALPQPKEPIKSHFSESGGYTTPAPEYKVKKEIKEAEGGDVRAEDKVEVEKEGVDYEHIQTVSKLQEKQINAKESLLVKIWGYLFAK